MATKTLRVTLADILDTAGPGGGTSGEVWARYVDSTGPRTIRHTDGTLVLPLPRRVPIPSGGVVDLTVVPADDATVHVDDQGFGIEVGWDVRTRGEHGRDHREKGSKVVQVLTADASPVQFGLKASIAPVIPGTTYLSEASGDVRYPQLETMRTGTVAAVVFRGTGIDPTGVSDSTVAMKALFDAGIAAGRTRFVGEPGATYKIAVADSQWLFRLQNTKGVTIDLSGCKLDNSGTSYTADTFTPIFLLDNAKDTTILLREYVGFTLPTPASHLGYRGATLVRAINGSDGVTLDARASNLRYGVQSGEYGDASKGLCRNFDVKLRGSMIGYPIALYLAEGIRHDLDVDGIHRIAYIAGCIDVRGVARWRDQYVAPIAYLITDALASGSDTVAQVAPPANPTTSRGSSNVDVTVIDKGSTVFQTTSVCAGISLSRVDPCRFENIRVRIYTVGTDTVSTTVGGFHLISVGVPAIWSRYTYNWEPTVVLDNITVSGIVDHSAQTAASNATGELYIYTKDDTGEGSGKYATVRKLQVQDLTVLKSSAGSPRDLYVVAREPVVPIQLQGVHAPGLGLTLQTSATVPTQLDNCTLLKITTAGVVTSLASLGYGNKVDTLAGSTANRVASQGIGGAGAVIMQKETTLTLTGASVTWVNAIPIGTILLGVQARIQTTITGATGYNLGVTGDISRFANRNDLTAGLAIGPASQAATEVSPKWYLGDTSIIVTAKTSNFTAGTMRVVITYIAFNPLTA